MLHTSPRDSRRKDAGSHQQPVTGIGSPSSCICLKPCCRASRNASVCMKVLGVRLLVDSPHPIGLGDFIAIVQMIGCGLM
jgi:hypothetical protein